MRKDKFFFKKKINKKILKEKKIAIAYSGGFDSNLILKVYYTIFRKKIFLIHICHKKSTDSYNFLKFCKSILNKRLFLIVGYVKINNKNKKKNGLESEERKERYKKIIKICKKKKINYVLVAHNLDDQVETFFLRLLRGSGSVGLECMKEYNKIGNIFFLRPFIKFRREKIIKIFKVKKIKYVDDYNNYNSKIDRNYIRKILKFINKKFKGFNKRILFFIDKIKLLNKIGLKKTKKDYLKTKLKLNKILKLNKNRRLNLISFLLKKENIEIPSKNWVLEIDKQIRSKSKNFIVKKNKITIFKKNNRIVFKNDNCKKIRRNVLRKL